MTEIIGRYFRIEVRLSAKERELVRALSEKQGLSQSDYIRAQILMKDIQNPDLMELYEEVFQYQKFFVQKKALKNYSFFMYMDKNAVRRVLESAKVSMYLLGEINMKEINKIITEYMELYRLLSPELKEIKEKGMKELENYKNKEYLESKLGGYRQITQIKQGRSSHIKSKTMEIVVQATEAKKIHKKKLKKKIDNSRGAKQ